MRIDFATEQLLSGEVGVERLTLKAKPYGRTLCVAAFGWRVVVDFITAPKALD